jgi:hypothetical protein
MFEASVEVFVVKKKPQVVASMKKKHWRHT